jgi:hypothetical protein
MCELISLLCVSCIQHITPDYRTCIALLFVFETFDKYSLKCTLLDSETFHVHLLF